MNIIKIYFLLLNTGGGGSFCSSQSELCDGHSDTILQVFLLSLLYRLKVTSVSSFACHGCELLINYA